MIAMLLMSSPAKRYQNPGLCQVLGALPSAVLSKVLFSVTKAFAESRTLGTKVRSTKIFLPSARHSAKSGSRPRTISRRLKLTTVTFAESRVLALAPCLPLGKAS
jgi:hypothetical protein